MEIRLLWFINNGIVKYNRDIKESLKIDDALYLYYTYLVNKKGGMT